MHRFLFGLLPLLSCCVALQAQDQELRKAAAKELSASKPGAVAKIEPETGRRWVFTIQHDGLAPQDGKGMAQVQGFAESDPDRGVKAFVREHQAYFGHDGSALDSAFSRRSSLSPSGLRTTVWQQASAGIPVDGAKFVAAIGKKQQIVSLSDTFESNVPEVLPVVAVSLGQALTLAAAPHQVTVQDVQVTVPAKAEDPRQMQTIRADALPGEIYGSLTWLPIANGHAACWRVSWIGTDHLTRATYVDVSTGQLHKEQMLTIQCSFGHHDCAGHGHKAEKQEAQHKVLPDLDMPTQVNGQKATPNSTPPKDAPQGVVTPFSMRVYPFPNESPRPNMPVTTNSPSEIPMALVNQGVVNATASPDGWITSSYTSGNNTVTYLDINNDNSANTSDLVLGTGSPITFDHTAVLSDATTTTTNRNAAVVNLFYWTNLIHDQLYDLGFDEASGNFQVNNFGRGGEGNDPVRAEAQDGSAINSQDYRNNANFSTNLDGIPGRMQMYLWTDPDRDGDLDATVIIHELGHGLSTRLVGGGDLSLNTLQAGGMGEGWSDFFAIALLAQNGDAVGAEYTVGAYAQNASAGIRSRPYTNNKTKNNLMLANVEGLTSVHAIGTHWCSFLWEMRCDFVSAYGFEIGHRRALQLVIDGMKLSPSAPTILEARDAILAAEMASNQGQDLGLIIAAFTRRGLGLNALGPISDSTSGFTQDTSPADPIIVSANGVYGYAAIQTITGSPRGPFTPTSVTLTFSNLSSNPAILNLQSSVPWLATTQSQLTLAAGASATTTVTLLPAANQLSLGKYIGTITYSGLSITRNVTFALEIIPNYVVSSTSYEWIDPASHPDLDLGDDESTSSIPMPFPFSFYGQNRSQVYIQSNGVVSFSQNSIGSAFNRSLLTPHSDGDAICVWWADLDPSVVNAKVTAATVGIAPDRKFVISWVNLPTYNQTPRYTFQCVLSESDQSIVMQYQEVQPAQSTYGAGRRGTIGVINANTKISTQYSYAGSTLLTNLSAIRFFIPNAGPLIHAPAHGESVLLP